MKPASYSVLILLIFLAGCERRLFLEKTPDIIYVDGRYVFDPCGYEYDKVLLYKDGINLELSSCKEKKSELQVFNVDSYGYYDLYIISGNDTSLVNNTYLGLTDSKVLRITALDVAQGDCFVVCPSEGVPSLIDGGYGSLGYEDWHGGGEKILADYLESKGLFDLKYIIETHNHQDHYGGLLDVAGDERFSVGGYLTYNSGFPDVGDTLFFSETVRGVMVHYGLIDGDEGTNENDRSAVIKLIYRDFEMIFTGDITGVAEEFILSGSLIDPSEEYEILKVAHHGSKHSSTGDFLNSVLPLYSIISAGAENTYGHPTEDALERIGNVGSSVLRTDINGTVDIFSDGSSFQISYSR